MGAKQPVTRCSIADEGNGVQLRAEERERMATWQSYAEMAGRSRRHSYATKTSLQRNRELSGVERKGLG